MLIDHIRLKRRTAANQSAAPIAEGDSPYEFARTVEIEGNVVRIVDRLSSKTDAIDPGCIIFSLKLAGGAMPKPPAAPASRQLTFVKTCDVSIAPPVFGWSNEAVLSDGARH